MPTITPVPVKILPRHAAEPPPLVTPEQRCLYEQRLVRAAERCGLPSPAAVLQAAELAALAQPAPF